MYRIIVVFMMTAVFYFGSNRVYAQGIKFMDDVKGKIVSKKQRVIKGFNTEGIVGMVNKLPIINRPVGYDVVESEAAFQDGKTPARGRVGIGISRLYMLHGKMTRQGEYPQVAFLLNRLRTLTRESYFLGEDTRKANLPEMFRDTVAFEREIRNGQEVWVATNQYDYEYRLIMINPRNKPCFKLVTKGQLATLWISKLGFEIEKYSKLIAENKEYLSSLQGAKNIQLKKNVEDGIKMNNLWLDYIMEKRKTYQGKLAALTAAQRNEPAETGAPVQLAVLVNRGVPVTKVTGDMRDEWADVMLGGVTKRQKLFIEHPQFFDAKLPRTSIQLIIIEDAFKIGERFEPDKKIKHLLNSKFYPELDYKALAGLMYR